jgi:hypothetical protein
MNALFNLLLGSIAWAGLILQTPPPGHPFIDGHSGNFVSASNQYVDYGNVSDETGSNPFSISVWVKMVSCGNYGIFLSKVNYGGGYPGYEIGTYPNCSTFLSLSSNGDFMLVDSTPITVTTGSWHNIVYTYSGSMVATGVNVYVDGVLGGNRNIGSPSLSVPLTNTMSLKVAGDFFLGNTTMDGREDEITKWPIVLTQANVTELYHSGTPTNITTLSFYGSSGFASSPRSLWIRFENSWNDVSQNHFTGTPVNSPTFSTDHP